MLALLADSDVLFVIRLGFGTGYVAHSVILPAVFGLFKVIKTFSSYVYSIYRYLSTDSYYMLCFLDGNH